MALASRGLRETPGGTEPVGDSKLAVALRRRATGVYVKTVIATLVTGAVLLAVRHFWDL